MHIHMSEVKVGAAFRVNAAHCLPICSVLLMPAVLHVVREIEHLNFQSLRHPLAHILPHSNVYHCGTGSSPTSGKSHSTTDSCDPSQHMLLFSNATARFIFISFTGLTGFYNDVILYYPLYSVSLPSLAFYNLFFFLVDIM